MQSLLLTFKLVTVLLKHLVYSDSALQKHINKNTEKRQEGEFHHGTDVGVITLDSASAFVLLTPFVLRHKVS